MFSHSAALVCVSLAAVLVEAHAGPALPEVDKVLTKAADKVQTFAARAAAMQARVAQRQEEKRAALAATKAKYEHKLEAQAAENQAVVEANEALRGNIASLEKTNTRLEGDAQNLQKDNDVMHEALSALKQKVMAAKLFLNNSLHATDDSKAAALFVLEPPKPKPTLSHFLAVAGGVAKPQTRSSLLQLRSQASSRREEPRAEDLVPALSQGLADLASADREGEAQLKASFLAAWEKAEARRGDLNTTQEELIAKRDALQSHQEALRTAKAHLLDTRRQLQQRLQGVRVFAQRVSSATGATLKRVGASSNATSQAAPAPAAATVADGKNVTDLLQTQSVGGATRPAEAAASNLWTFWR